MECIDGIMYVRTPHTQTLIPAKNRSKNELYRKEYFRMRHRKENTQPYVNANGEWRNRVKYQPRGKTFCIICQRDVFCAWFDRHTKSKVHSDAYDKWEKETTKFRCEN